MQTAHKKLSILNNLSRGFSRPSSHPVRSSWSRQSLYTNQHGATHIPTHAQHFRQHLTLITADDKWYAILNHLLVVCGAVLEAILSRGWVWGAMGASSRNHLADVRFRSVVAVLFILISAFATGNAKNNEKKNSTCTKICGMRTIKFSGKHFATHITR